MTRSLDYGDDDVVGVVYIIKKIRGYLVRYPEPFLYCNISVDLISPRQGTRCTAGLVEAKYWGIERLWT